MGKFWIARDKFNYVIVKGMLHMKRDENMNGDEIFSGTHYFCPESFESFTGLKLKIGEGPVQVEIKRVRK